jgi:uncharacterized protein
MTKARKQETVHVVILALLAVVSMVTLSTGGAWAQELSVKLIEACKNGDSDSVTSLLQQGASPDAFTPDEPHGGMTALRWAVIRNHLNVVKVLLEAGADVNAKSADGITVLMVAAATGNTEMVGLFLDKGAEIDAQCSRGTTALMSASEEGNVDIMRMLLERGAAVNTKTLKGATALVQACIIGSPEYKNTIVVRPGPPGAGKDTLEFARVKSRPEAVTLLLDKGVDVNGRVDLFNDNGWTPLMIAAEKGDLDLVKLLLKRGADPNAKSKQGNTASSVAAEKGFEEIVKVLSGKSPQ